MRKFKRNAPGFTLIEIMIVTAIIAGSVMLAMPYLSNRNSQMRSFLRKVTVLSRELHTRAKLNGANYRMVIDMPARPIAGEPPEQKIWVERSNSQQVVLSEDDEANALELARERDQDKENKKPDPKGFERDDSFLKQPLELPAGIYIDSVELTRLKSPVKEGGKAFVHYLKQGLVDEAAIHIKGTGTQAWTIAIHPLTGRAEIIAKPRPLKEIRDQ